MGPNGKVYFYVAISLAGVIVIAVTAGLIWCCVNHCCKKEKKPRRPKSNTIQTTSFT